MENEKITTGLIKLNIPNDIAFSNIAQKACVTGATLPSGYVVPNTGYWIIASNFLINVEKFETMKKKPE